MTHAFQEDCSTRGKTVALNSEALEQGLACAEIAPWEAHQPRKSSWASNDWESGTGTWPQEPQRSESGATLALMQRDLVVGAQKVGSDWGDGNEGELDFHDACEETLPLGWRLSPNFEPSYYDPDCEGTLVDMLEMESGATIRMKPIDVPVDKRAWLIVFADRSQDPIAVELQPGITRIGRDRETSHLVLEDAGVGLEHVAIVQTAPGRFEMHGEEGGKTFLNGREALPCEHLFPNDVIHVGAMHLKFVVEAPTPQNMVWPLTVAKQKPVALKWNAKKLVTVIALSAFVGFLVAVLAGVLAAVLFAVS